MPDVTPQEQEPKPVSSFKEVLLQSAFSKGWAIPDAISEIELGIFGQEGRNLVLQMMQDPRHREFGKLVYITKARKVFLQNEPIVGDEGGVSHTFKTNILIDDPKLPWFIRQDRMCGTTLHSHPEDIAPSSQDLLYLLVGDFHYSAERAVFVSTLKRNFVIFRGKDTPQFTLEQVNEKIALWENSIKGRVTEFTDPFMTRPEQMEINNKARTALLRQIGQKYDLKIFAGEATGIKVSLLR